MQLPVPSVAPRVLSAAALVLFTFSLSGPLHAQQRDAQRPQADRNEQNRDTQDDRKTQNDQQKKSGDAEAAAQAATMGVAVIATPDEVRGVRIVALQPEGPAAKSRLREGDYLLFWNDREIKSPSHLRELVRASAPGTTVNVIAWRNGERVRAEVELEQLDSRVARAIEQEEQLDTGDDPQAEERREIAAKQDDSRGWLGVMLGEDENRATGVRIVNVFPDGPADEAGIRPGDEVVTISGEDVRTREQLDSELERHSPGDEVYLTLRRRGEGRIASVTLGKRSEFFSQQSERSDRPRNRLDEMEPYEIEMEHAQRMAQQHERLETLVQEVLDEVRQLRAEVNTLRQGNAAAQR